MNGIQDPIFTHAEALVTSHNNGAALPRFNTISRFVKMNHHRISSPIFSTTKLEIKHQVITKAPPLPPMKNAATSCKPILHTKGITCRPRLITKETQTDEIKEKTIVVPVPVPIYIPAPMPMYSVPLPVPIPFPVPIAVPVFIPTTQNSTSDILKELKMLQVEMAKDLSEEELLMMNEMVATEETVSTTYSESEDNDDNGAVPENYESVDDQQQPINALVDQTNFPIRERKRPNRQPRDKNNAAKRVRSISCHVEVPSLSSPQPDQQPEPIDNPNICLKYTLGMNAWKQWVTIKNAELEKSSVHTKLIKDDILRLTDNELNYSLCLFIKEIRKPNGTEYAPDIIYYFCLGIQQYLFENGRNTNIFTDASYEKFTDCLNEIACNFSVIYDDVGYIVTRVEEEHLWESRQLGAHSPYALLTSLIYFNTKYFKLATVDEHMQLSFCHVVKQWKGRPNPPDTVNICEPRNRVLRYRPSQKTLDSKAWKKKVYEQNENKENHLRCPVKLFDFYMSKCPENIKTRSDVFYILPERSCIPESPVWYSTTPLDRRELEKILHRVKMLKEINLALLTND